MFKWPLMWRKTHEEIEKFHRLRVEVYSTSWWLLFEENEKLRKEIKDLKAEKTKIKGVGKPRDCEPARAVPKPSKEKKKPAKQKGKK